MRIFNWFRRNIFLAFTLFLVAFIPLFPKIPLLGVTHVNVYVRAEDFIVLFFVLVYLIQLIRKKVPLKTPLTVVIFAFWLSGLISTVLGLIFIFPHLADSNITNNPVIYTRNAFLYYARHIEYMSLFFIAYAGIKSKKNINVIVNVIISAFLIVVLYGLGQRFIPQKFPAFSTMNEEFAKGIPLVLDVAGRLQSTFAGHYDFAAYLVMMIPLIGSLIFGYKNWFVRMGLLIIDFMAFFTLLMTQSRTSFVMYLLAVIFMLVLQKQKKWILPVIIISFILLRTFTGLYARYSATFSVVNRVVDARTGKVVGYAGNENGKLVINNVQPSGHDLYAGSLSTNGKKIGSSNNVTIQTKKGNSKLIDTKTLQGNFIIQKASALDASITTRLQAEWPNAINAFKRNILFGSGYSSITLATDGNYLRFLGETGLLGFGIFGLIFLIYAIYAAKTIGQVDDPLSRSFVIGVGAGVFGLGLNATLIDVFEASKIAYVLWILVGISIGILDQYRKKNINILKEIIYVLTSIPAFVVYLAILPIVFFWPMLNNFFVADDFTWLRWVGDCNLLMQKGVLNCSSKIDVLANFFTNSGDFFYRPGMKAYFFLIYNSQFGGLSPVIYHIVSLSIHTANTIIIFLISTRLLKNKFLAFLSSLIFLLLSSHSETIYWISASGHLFATLFILLGLFLYIKWSEKGNSVYLMASLASVFAAPLFHEYGVIGPVLIIAIGLVNTRFSDRKVHKAEKKHYIFYAIPLVLYLILKIVSNSFWSAGDYKYNLLKLPLNVAGNLFGFFGFVFIGNPFLSAYQALRDSARVNILLSSILVLILFLSLVVLCRKLFSDLDQANKKDIVMGILFFVIPLLPFLALGNIAPRYGYLASYGLILLVVLVLQKIYFYISQVNRYFALAAVLLISILYMSIQVSQLKKESNDWKKAGEITSNFIQYMNDGYEILGLGEIKKPTFYFVNVPKSYGTALILPVGIDDAVWFEYKENKLTTHSVSKLNEARTSSFGDKSARIFVFDNKGNVSIRE